MASEATSLPSGTVTFLFTDIEGSTELLKRLRDQYATVLADQRRILREIFTRQHGQEVDTQGDSFFISFPRATDAITAAVEAQKALAGHLWPKGVEVRVRMGLHTGEPMVAEEGYVGMDVHRAARIAHVGHGGQVLLSETTASLVRDELPESVSLIDLGRHRLKDMRRPEHIRQLVIEGLSSEFPPLTSLEALPPEVQLEVESLKLPSYLEEVEERPAPVFVGREHEMARLDGYLAHLMGGNGQVVFVTGGPGRGKTALLDAFARRAMTEHEALLVVKGNCSAHTGLGDPYLPFRDTMEMLTGDLEGRWASGRISRNCAVRLWEAMPEIIRALVEVGPGLIDVFVSGRSLLRRARESVVGGRVWMERLASLCEGERASQRELEGRNLFEQYGSVLGEVAERHPLVIVLDDLQWVDSASINLLFQLGQRGVGKRILILGAYRAEEVVLGRGDEPHPLEKVLSEFKRLYGDIWIDLSDIAEVEAHSFVEDYLDSEPNRLAEEFRTSLYKHTGGHPLFTVELLKDMQEHQILIHDENGCWIEGQEINWDTLPPRVEGVIEERIGRLGEEQRSTLRIASVEGEDFTAQVVAKVQQVSERHLLGMLSRELVKRHRLVCTWGEIKVGEHILSRYRFSHSLFQKFLYNDLSSGERRMLHGEVARVLEELYTGETEAIAVQLAHHYSEADQINQAVKYLQVAGDRARMVYAHQEAVEHYQRALRFLKERGDHEQASQVLMKLGLVYTADFKPEEARKAYMEAFAIWEPLRSSMDLQGHEIPAAALRIAIAEPLTVDPGMAGDDFSVFIAGQLFEGLVEISTDYNVLPAAAVRWEVLGEGSEYTFHLQEGLKWSDGSPLTAGDFEYAWKRNLTLASQSTVTDFLYVIRNARKYADGELDDLDKVGVKASDDRTLQVLLESPTAYFPHLLAHPVTYPLPRRIIEMQGQSWPDIDNLVSNGPYQLTEWEPGERLVLSKNPFYRGYFPGNAQTVECPIITDFEEVFKAYDLDALDAISMIGADPGTIARTQAAFPEDFFFTPHPSTVYLTFLSDRPPFDDVQVRWAFIQAVDRDALVCDATHNQFLAAKGGFLHPSMPGHSATIGLEYNPEEGRRQLVAAGYPEGDGFPQVSVLYTGGVRENQIISFLQRSWHEQLGIQVEAQNVEWGEFLERRKHNPTHLLLSGWLADYPDPDSMLRVLFHSSEGINPPRWHHERFDALVEEAARITNQQERLDLYREADRILIAEEAVIMPLGYVQGRYLVKPWVSMPRVSPILQRLKNVIVRQGI